MSSGPFTIINNLPLSCFSSRTHPRGLSTHNGRNTKTVEALYFLGLDAVKSSKINKQFI
jgi:hypothetical protein